MRTIVLPVRLNSRLVGETVEIKAGNNERNSFMGHIVGKDVLHRKLGKKIDSFIVRAPWNETLHEILKELYNTEEADLTIKMPYRLSGFDRIQKIHLIEKLKLQKLIEGICAKGLVPDVKGVLVVRNKTCSDGGPKK